jgi:N-acetylglucosaminyl-diphospho-decaprenol L-rhamnosyltransferase
VIAVTHDSSKAIERWLESLAATDLRDELELCVVDSGSSPAERAFLAERVAHRVDVLLMRPNLGYGRCSNLGAAATDADVLVFTNPDTCVRSLPSCVRHGRPPSGVVLGAVNRSNGRVLPTGFRNMPSARWEAGRLLLGRFGRGYRPAWEDPAWVSGAALIIASDDFRRIGGFSEEIFLYFEDADLCARHRECGGTVAIDREFVIEHEPGMSSIADHDLDGVARWSGRIFATRHGGRARAAVLYVLLAGYYVPRRVVLTLLRKLVGRGESVHITPMVLDLLRPRRVLRRLEVPEPRSVGIRLSR